MTLECECEQVTAAQGTTLKSTFQENFEYIQVSKYNYIHTNNLPPASAVCNNIIINIVIAHLL